MWNYPEEYDLIVIGAGHAGCEAALAGARRGANTLLLTMNLDTIAKMSCNPAIGGIGKGHLVREIDALGGEMGKVTDCTGIQFRMLNASRGPAVWAPRAQSDKALYQLEMKERLEKQEFLDIKQGTTTAFVIHNDRVEGVRTQEGIFYKAKAVILASGTFMRGLLHLGEQQWSGGRAGDKPSVGLSADLEKHGFTLQRLKTGTPPRVNARTIDFDRTEQQFGQEGVFFSYDPPEKPRLPQVCCHITYTTKETQAIIERNIDRSPLYSGKIEGVGPRYCPSIEDKVVRFADKERHQIFLEPEGLQTQEVYVNGISSSLPFDVQYEMVHSVIGLEKAQVMRPAYAIEYDCVSEGQIDFTLQTKLVENLYFAGQINGTTGYEEAAAQGLMAAINAVNKQRGEEPFILNRSEAYIGVLIDDLVTKGFDEPYRMFTSRAEHRLLLRQDNAEMRLREYGYQLGLIDRERYDRFVRKKQLIEKEVARLKQTFKQIKGRGYSLAQLLARPENNYHLLQRDYPEEVELYADEIVQQIEFNIKYEGYIAREHKEVAKLETIEKVLIPVSFDFNGVKGLRYEAQEKLQALQPTNLGQAARTPGVSPADISVLMVALQKN